MSGTRAPCYPNPLRLIEDDRIILIVNMIKCWRRDEATVQKTINEGWQVGEEDLDRMICNLFFKASSNFGELTDIPRVKQIVEELLPLGIDEIRNCKGLSRGISRNGDLKSILKQINNNIDFLDQDIFEEMQRRKPAQVPETPPAHSLIPPFDPWSNEFVPPPRISGYYGPENRLRSGLIDSEEEQLEKDMIAIAIQRSIDDHKGPKLGQSTLHSRNRHEHMPQNRVSPLLERSRSHDHQGYPSTMRPRPSSDGVLSSDSELHSRDNSEDLISRFPSDRSASLYPMFSPSYHSDPSRIHNQRRQGYQAETQSRRPQGLHIRSSINYCHPTFEEVDDYSDS